MVIEINKDIDRYQESVAMGLTAKQLIFSIASVVVGGGIVLLLYKYIGLTGSAYVAIPCVAPIALGGFYSFNGMSFYEYMGKKLYFMFANRALTYVSTEGEPTIKVFQLEQTEQVKKKSKKAETEITTLESAVKKQEEFEAMKKKTRNMLLGLVAVIVTAVAGIAAYKAMH
ncbi:PrgI family protein [Agathobacter sp. LCP21S3_B2]|uniref:PrgI family protein n=1 Tax=Agathobacter sp. LCP21S3_B2 TaxID=3438734 RepID=UPI003F8F9418